MIYLVTYLLIIILNLVLAFFRKNSYSILIVSILCLSILAGFSKIDQNSDAALYSAFYNGQLGYTPSWASSFIAIETFFPRLGINFYWFRFLLFGIGFSFALFGCRCFKVNYHLIVFAYSICLFVFLSVTIRFFCSFSIISFSIHYIVGPKKKPIIYTLFVLLAASFHTTAIFYILLLLNLVPTTVKKGFTRILLIVDITGFVISILYYLVPSLFINSISVFNSLIKLLFPNLTNYVDKYIYYRGIMSPLYSISFLLFLIFFLYLNKNISSYGSDRIRNSVNDILIIILICAFHFYTIMFTLEMIRFWFIALFFIFVVAASFLYGKDVRKSKMVNAKNILVMIICMAFWFYSIYGRKIYGYDLLKFITENQFFAMI